MDDARAAAALLRGDLAQVRTHPDAAWRAFATEGAAFNSADTLETETRLALLVGNREDADRWLAAFDERMASYGGAPVSSAVLRAGIAFRFGDDGALRLSARRALELVGAPERTSIVAVLMYATLAEHHAPARACDEAVEALAQIARMVRNPGALRFVAHVALAARLGQWWPPPAADAAEGTVWDWVARSLATARRDAAGGARG